MLVWTRSRDVSWQTVVLLSVLLIVFASCSVLPKDVSMCDCKHDGELLFLFSGFSSFSPCIQSLPRIPPGQECEMNVVCYLL